MLGAVAYDPKVVTIWQGFADWFAGHGFAVRLRPLLELRGAGRGPPGRRTSTSPGTRRWPGCGPAGSPRPPAATAHAVAMRDTDQDLTSVVLVRADSDIGDVAAHRRPHGGHRRP